MPPAETAIGILSKSLTNISNNPFPLEFSEPSKALLDYAGAETDFPYRTIFANRWLFGGILKNQFSQKPSSAALLHTTIAPTLLQSGIKDNVLPTVAEGVINFRISPNDNIQKVQQRMISIIDDERVSVALLEEEHSEPSRISSYNSIGFKTLNETIRGLLPDTKVAPALVIALTDSRHFEEVTENTYRFLPLQLTNDDLPRIHGIDERISIENYKLAINFYYYLLKKM